ncbi:MAG: hypothetical protein H0W75_12530 [Chitinophagaceae bacterium]|nr:hypothetical protein [Chitinophagaceae bacterium]
MDNKNLRQQKIKDLPFTGNLKDVLAQNNINTVKDLLNLSVPTWHKNFPGFTYHHQHELISFLQESNLMEFLKED